MTAQTIAFALATLAGIVLLILGAGRAARATGLARPAQRLRIVDQLSLGRTSTLRIVACDGREMLLLCAAAHDTNLGWLPPSPLHAAHPKGDVS